MTEDPGPAFEVDPDEAIWIGGAARIDLDDYVHGDLGAWSALDQILLAIIGAHRNADVGRRGGEPKQKDIVQYRLEQAKRYLIGRAPPKGQVPRQYEEVLDRVARRYFLAALGISDRDATLRSLLVSEATTEEQQRSLDHKEIDNLIRGHLRAFKRHKHRLLVKASAGGLPEVYERARKIAHVIRLLTELGVIAPEES
jgi:hypothetical protein